MAGPCYAALLPFGSAAELESRKDIAVSESIRKWSFVTHRLIHYTITRHHQWWSSTYSTALSAWEPEDGPGSATKLPHPCPVLLKVIKTDCLSSQNTNTQNNKYKNTTKTQGSPSLPCPLESLDCKIQIHKITNTRMQQKHKLPHSN